MMNMVFNSGLLGLVQQATQAAQQPQTNLADAAELLTSILLNRDYRAFAEAARPGEGSNPPLHTYSLDSMGTSPDSYGIHITAEGIRILQARDRWRVFEWGSRPDDLQSVMQALNQRRPFPPKEVLDTELAAGIRTYIREHYDVRVAEPDVRVV